MPPKPRPHGKPRPPAKKDDRSRLLLLGAGGVAAIAAVAVALAFTLGGGGGSGDARAALEEAGCTLTATPALVGEHSVTTPSGTSKEWNTTPATSGAHYEIPVVYGLYDEPVNQAQLVHNLEHGAIAVQYGEDVPQETVRQLREFTQSHPRGTVLAPYPALGDQISLGAWVTDDDPAEGTAYLAKCASFDEAAFSAFFDAYQFRGPERFPPDALLPGRS